MNETSFDSATRRPAPSARPLVAWLVIVAAVEIGVGTLIAPASDQETVFAGPSAEESATTRPGAAQPPVVAP